MLLNFYVLLNSLNTHICKITTKGLCGHLNLQQNFMYYFPLTFKKQVFSQL